MIRFETMSFKRVIMLLLLVLIGHGLQAQDTLFTDRPTVSYSPNTMPKKWFQVEMGFQYQIADANLDGNLAPGLKIEDLMYNSALFRYAITDRIEIRYTQFITKSRFRLNGATTSEEKTEFAPSKIGTKINLFSFKNGGPRFSLLADYGTQLITDNGGGDELEVLLLFHSKLFKNFSFDYNLGWNWSEDLGFRTFKYSFLFSRSISKRFWAYAEVFGIVPEEGDQLFNYDLGVTYLVNNTFQLDLYGGAGFTDTSPDVIVGFGISKLFLPRK